MDYIVWNPNPELFTLGPVTVRWYGLLFASGFLIGQSIVLNMFRKEGKPEQDVETLTLYMILSTIIGARLGHCLFYDPVYYLSNPLKILAVWEGGLASHGATIGILTGIYLYTHYSIKTKLLLGFIPVSFSSVKRDRPGQSYLWVLDRLVVVIALGGAFIRFGNLMNSEIVGKPTDVPWAFIFERLSDPNLNAALPRHPAQLYEAISCLLLFFFLYFLWNKQKQATPIGSLFSIFLVWVFGLRFLYEFLKENQEAFEASLPLNMGQILSIPLVLMGLYLLYRIYLSPQKKQEA